MDDIFLNAQLKAFYMEDFNNLINSDREFWRIDNEFLKEKLIAINSNPQVQTLYSKCELQGLTSEESYLEFAFCEPMELKIFRSILPEMLLHFNSFGREESNCYYRYSKPGANPNYKPNSEKFGMRCVDDEDYFKINSIKICLKTINSETKKEFWNELVRLFSR